MNDELDKDDMDEDAIFACDMLNKVRTLLEEAIIKSNNSPRKLQNWIQQIDQVYRPMLTQLQPMEVLENSIEGFNALLEEANVIYDEWLDKETTERVKKEMEAMEKLKKQRYKRTSKKRRRALDELMQRQLQINKATRQGDESDSSDSDSDDDEIVLNSKENLSPELTEEARKINCHSI